MDLIKNFKKVRKMEGTLKKLQSLRLQRLGVLHLRRKNVKDFVNLWNFFDKVKEIFQVPGRLHNNF